jgi:hypothetical protein
MMSLLRFEYFKIGGLPGYPISLYKTANLARNAPESTFRKAEPKSPILPKAVGIERKHLTSSRINRNKQFSLVNWSGELACQMNSKTVV